MMLGRTVRGSRFPPPPPSRVHHAQRPGGRLVSITESVSSLIFTGPLTWTGDAACQGQNELFFAPAGERPETRSVREAKARAICRTCCVMEPCRQWAREHRE